MNITVTLLAVLFLISIITHTNPSVAGNWNQSERFDSIELDFGTAIEEIYFLDSADVNADGFDDFVVSGLVDVYSQIGVGCCNVPPNLVEKIKPLRPILLLSNGHGSYDKTKFPETGDTIRAWTGTFFKHKSKFYFFLGRNGEISDPIDGNKGETSVLFNLVVSEDNKVQIQKVAETFIPATTASIQIIPGRDGKSYIIENNYLDFNEKNPWSRSYIYQFNGKDLQAKGPKPTGFDFNKANNHLNVTDLDGDGKYDIIVASEVMFHFDTGSPQTSNNGSYVIFDALGTPTTTLLPHPYFGQFHAGSHTAVIDANSKKYVIELGVRLEERNQFREPGLSVYHYTEQKKFKKLRLVHKDLFDIQKFQMSNTQLIDIDADGSKEILFQNYSSQPLYMDFDTLPTLKKVPKEMALVPKSGKARVVALKAKECLKLASIEDYKKARRPILKISRQCLITQ